MEKESCYIVALADLMHKATHMMSVLRSGLYLEEGERGDGWRVG